MKMRKHEKYVRRLAALLLSAVLAAGLLSGCGKGKTEEQNKENTSVKGRYVEADIELPIQDGEKILNMVKSKDGNPVLFSQAEGGQVFRYEYKEGDWELAQLDWITQLYDGQNFHLQESSFGLKTNISSCIIKTENLLWCRRSLCISQLI